MNRVEKVIKLTIQKIIIFQKQYQIKTLRDLTNHEYDRIPTPLPLPGGLPLPLPATLGTRTAGTKSSGIPNKIFFGRPGRPFTLSSYVGEKVMNEV